MRQKIPLDELTGNVGQSTASSWQGHGVIAAFICWHVKEISIRMRRLAPSISQIDESEESSVRSYKLLLTALMLISCLCVSVMPQNPAPIGIRPEPPEGKGGVALRAARLIAGTGAAPISNAVVIVTNNKITAVGDTNSARIPPGARVIDLGNVTLLPGFIDAHTHLVGRVLGDPLADVAVVRDYASYGAILGVANARSTLM